MKRNRKTKEATSRQIWIGGRRMEARCSVDAVTAMEGYLWMRRLYGGDWELGFRVRAAGGRGCVWMSGRFGRGPWRLGYGLCFSYVNRRRVWAAFSVRVGGRRSTEQPCQRAARRGFAPGTVFP